MFPNKRGHEVFFSDDTTTIKISFVVPDGKVDRESLEQAAKIINIYDLL